MEQGDTAIPAEFALADVLSHVDRKDIYLVIHDKVYDASPFIDEHPGGEEVLLDVAGKDATNAFEDVGHSDEAREVLEKLYIGNIKVMNIGLVLMSQASDKKSRPKAKTAIKSVGALVDADSGTNYIGVFFIIGAIVAFAAYKYMQKTTDAQHP
ncbi:putative cytochrome b5 [Neolecta irregularis DAH-3]|uniref:Putative cytochrome b5 n=1 Tax=Neolecta irregularis (strain DAH-3) TaxID=1198029 RepID=A0A1U7LVQ4_NEOID|nr:putative cytochrome b5 [Neolecta irregularis DAH-3]|eukprot:OLL26653.1 putative cytochrome b5 [Neolecta irregularis DAH-3]